MTRMRMVYVLLLTMVGGCSHAPAPRRAPDPVLVAWNAGDQPGAIAALLDWAGAGPVSSLPPIASDLSEREVIKRLRRAGPNGQQTVLRPLQNEYDALKALTRAVLDEAATAAAAGDLSRAHDLIDAAEALGVVHQRPGFSRYAVMVGKAIQAAARTQRARLFP